MPEHMNELASFVFYRTYSRWQPELKRRETWKEVVRRSVEYNVGISIKQFNQNNFKPPIDKIIIEAETLFDNIFNLKQFLSGRTHWVGGASTGVADKFPLSNFNCAFIEIKSWSDLCDLFYMLLIGTGVGFRCSKEMASNLPPIRTDFELTHSEYNPLPKHERLESTTINIMPNGYAKIYVGDSKEGWVEALRYFLDLITLRDWNDIKHIKINYNSIRPKGERLHTFGGTASGYEPMKEMFEGFDKVIKSELEDGQNLFKVRPIHILDMGNLIGNNVVVGGVRRTAEMFMCDADDIECIKAKKDISKYPHRAMSNNSIAFESKPTREQLHEIFQLIKENGEPGFVNLESAKKRRPGVKGLNPCGEVLLDSYGVCNLTTVNVMGFVKYENDVPVLNFSGLAQAQVLSVRAGLRMTCIDLELNHWNVIQQRDRLIACSLTGWKDAMSVLGYSEEQEKCLLNLLREISEREAIRYSYILRIPQPLLTTTIKPEGTLSQVANGVSQGLHVSFAPYYIRRIRINAHDALVQVAKDLGWTVHENDGRTYVIDFPVKSGATKTRAEQTLEEQFNTYFMFQEHYTTHNSSITITVRDDEWEQAEELIWENWDKFIGVTFIPYDGGNYELAPYEEITKEQYEELKSKMKPFNPDLLQKYESDEACSTEEGMEDCESGVCPVR